MSAQILRLTRRDFGIAHDVFIVRCSSCRWKTEVGDMANAVALATRHECKGAAA